MRPKLAALFAVCLSLVACSDDGDVGSTAPPTPRVFDAGEVDGCDVPDRLGGTSLGRVDAVAGTLVLLCEDRIRWVSLWDFAVSDGPEVDPSAFIGAIDAIGVAVTDPGAFRERGSISMIPLRGPEADWRLERALSEGVTTFFGRQVLTTSVAGEGDTTHLTSLDRFDGSVRWQRSIELDDTEEVVAVEEEFRNPRLVIVVSIQPSDGSSETRLILDRETGAVLDRSRTEVRSVEGWRVDDGAVVSDALPSASLPAVPGAWVEEAVLIDEEAQRWVVIVSTSTRSTIWVVEYPPDADGSQRLVHVTSGPLRPPAAVLTAPAAAAVGPIPSLSAANAVVLISDLGIEQVELDPGCLPVALHADVVLDRMVVARCEEGPLAVVVKPER